MIFQRTQAFFLLSILLALAVSALGQAPNSSRWGPGRPPPDENPQFFPSQAFAPERMTARALSWYLRTMAEKPLVGYLGSDYAQVYRVVVLPRWRPPVVVRLVLRRGGTGELTVKVGQTYRTPEILDVNKSLYLSRTDADQFLKLVGEEGFWSMPVVAPFDITKPVEMGQTSWMIEASAGGKYHVVDRLASELGTLKPSVVFLVQTLANVQPDSLPIDPEIPRQSKRVGNKR